MMRLQVIGLLTIWATAPSLCSPQRRPSSEDQKFTKRFNPSDDVQRDQQSDQQQHQQQYAETTTFIPIIRFNKEQTVDGGYKTLWETGNNILAEETGVLKHFNADPENPQAVVQQGSYMYTSPEGQLITVQYIADENGFRATGDHLPTPPPIPADIQRSLEQIYAGIQQQQQQHQLSDKPNDNVNFQTQRSRQSDGRSRL